MGKPRRENIGRETLFWMLVANLMIIVPLFDKLTLWTAGICGICFLWRIGIYFGQVAKPPRYLVTLLAVGAATTLALVAKEIGALKALINLLILGYTLKYIESRNYRDVRTIVLVGYFLIALTFIYYQGIGNTAQLLINTLINTCILLSLYQHSTRVISTAKVASKLLLLSAPLAILLFIMLPRLPPLWLVPDLKSAKTGLSNEVSFGDIGELTRSDELAFRATFDNTVPSNDQLYWRAIVMENFDGKNWSQSDSTKDIEALFSKPFQEISIKRQGPLGDTIDYSIIAEPSHQQWLFSLDIGFSPEQEIAELPDFRLFSKTPLDNKRQYRVSSAINQQLDPILSTKRRSLNLQLPSNSNPKTKQLAQEFAQAFPNPSKRLNAMMRYFAEQAYFYTLRPPPVGPQQIDDFLFENKAGFCVHYASALVFMARSTGIPARLVTGYQGGEYNPNAGYFSIYQYMAHAWTEVWLEDKGWVRLDPTAMIAPDRILDGFDAYFDDQETLLDANPFHALRIKQIPWLNELRLAFASLDYHWSVWVLGFDDDKQEKLLAQLLGKISLQKIGLFMLAMLAAIGLIIAFSAGLIRLPKRQDPVDKAYGDLIKQLNKKRLNIPTHLGPTSIATWVGSHLQPNDAVIDNGYNNKLMQSLDKRHLVNEQVIQDFQQISQDYVALKYQSLTSETQIKLRRLFLKRARKLRAIIFKLRPVDREISNT